MDSTKADILLSQLRALHKQYYTDGQQNEVNKLALADVVKRYTILLEHTSPVAEQTLEAESEIEEQVKEQITAPIVEEIVEATAPAPVKEVVEKIAAPEPQPKEEITPKPEPQKTVRKIPADMQRLFKQAESKEISFQLANQPINNLGLAMSINERQLTIQELFGGDVNAFDRAIRELDSAPNFEAAQTFLLDHIIDHYNWNTDALHKKAQIFIQLVKRRHPAS